VAGGPRYERASHRIHHQHRYRVYRLAAMGILLAWLLGMTTKHREELQDEVISDLVSVVVDFMAGNAEVSRESLWLMLDGYCYGRAYPTDAA